ncbi:uncharacterized protein LOC120913185 isoform X2 [Rana temporaria]|uniref:uncharacterized protein LOC120913185 isoform X2 n=1 Tax=Rana temporaria TaxID=8407 RepID=UPI001AAD8103|nr:uncharacterized protein LOC120913185 isoform X2 [Rana temporaria]
MEDAAVGHCDESSSEDHNRPGNGILLDIVNGCHLSHTAVLAKAVASDHFQLEESVKSEDLLNNNKEVSEQDYFTNQRIVSSGDFSTVSDQISAANNPKESFLTLSKDRNSTEYKETLNHLRDSCQTTDKGKIQDGRELCNVQSKQALSDYTLKNNISKDISESSEIFQGELQYEEFDKDTHNPCEVNMSKLQENSEDEEESYATESILGDWLKDKERLEINNFKETSVSDSDMFKRDLLDEVTKLNIESTRESLDRKPQGCDKTIHTENHVNNHAVHLKLSKFDIPSTKQKESSSMEQCDVLAHNVCESEDSYKNNSLDFQTKRFGLCLPKNDSTKRGKRKKEHRSLKCGRLQPVLHELEFVEEEDLSEKEESSEEDNMDNSFHYSCSKDGLDHRKERHQYVSDKLDPDVLQLLEMHLRKQQLVDIKEEGEEEMIDVHINKEMTRSDSYKLLRNIPPVLDMVLEEPELEHAGDMLEDGSKTPSDIDSDDSSIVCSMELGLMESLQNDLMSKSSKIDKHELATILSETSPDCLSRGNKSKQREDASCHSECKPKHGNVQNQEPKPQEVQMKDPSSQPIIHEDGPEDLGSGIASQVVEAVEDISTSLYSESNFSELLKDIPEQPLAHEKETVEAPIIENTDLTEAEADQSLDLPSLDLASDVTQQKESESDTEVDESKLLDSSTFNDSETVLPDSAKAENALDSPCPIFDGHEEPHVLGLESRIPSEETDGCYPGDGEDFGKENDHSEQHDGVNRFLTNQQLDLTGVDKDLKTIKANVKSQTESSSSEAPFTADMNTLHEDLKRKILSLLEKAHAADCRSSHLQAEAELLFKESIELRHECKSLSKEAAELLSIVTQQEILHGHQRRQSLQDAEAESSLCISDHKPRTKETLSFVSKRTSKKKAESQLQTLSKKYSFLRQEAPEIMRELHVLQQDLKNLPPHHSKPIGFLYKWLWGGLIAGSTMFLVWWSTKQLG